jgi:hypothetical protein
VREISYEPLKDSAELHGSENGSKAHEIGDAEDARKFLII